MTRVFLSHAADADADAGEAARLAADLRAAGVDVWMTPDSIQPGVPLRPARGTRKPSRMPPRPEPAAARRLTHSSPWCAQRWMEAPRASGTRSTRRRLPTESVIDSVVEVALLRIGVAAWPAGSATTGHMLADIERELRANPHRVVAVLAVSSGESTALTPHQLLNAPSPNAMVLVWKESDGADAVGTAIGLIVQILTGGTATSPQHPTNR